MVLKRSFLSTEGWSLTDVALPHSDVKLGFAHKTGGEEKAAHRHKSGEHEVFLILRGSAEMKVDGEVVPLNQGDLIIINAEEHGISNKSTDFEVVLMMIMPANQR